MSETDDLINRLADEQHRRCAYGTREGDGRTCDCKFAVPFSRATSETTGCPELRRAIWVLRPATTHRPETTTDAREANPHG